MKRTAANLSEGIWALPSFPLVLVTVARNIMTAGVVDYPGTHRWFIGAVQAVHLDDAYRRDQPLMYWSGEYRKVGELLERTWE